MANVLKMTMVEAIRSMRSAGLSCREIARRLGVHRETVSRYARAVLEPSSKPASAPNLPAGTGPALAGFDAPTGSADTIRDTVAGLPRSPPISAGPWLAWLVEQRDRGLSVKRIHQDLQAEHPAAAVSAFQVAFNLSQPHRCEDSDESAHQASPGRLGGTGQSRR